MKIVLTSPEREKYQEIFRLAHEGTGEKFGWHWFNVNRKIVHYLYQIGLPTDDLLIKAICSMIARIALDATFERKETP